MRRNRIVSFMFGLAFMTWIIFPPVFLILTAERTLQFIQNGGPIAFFLESVHPTYDQAIILWIAGAILAALFLLAMAVFSVRLPGDYVQKLREKTMERRGEQ